MKLAISDEDLIRQQFSSHPNQCFEALYSRYVGKVYQRCLSMTKDSDQAQDFTHDIFLKAFSKLDAFQERARFSTWLYSIAYNYCADQLRLAKRLPTTTLEDSPAPYLAASNESQIAEEALSMVSQALKQLPAEDRRLLSLKYEDGMSVEEIAQLYDINVSTVKMRLKRGRDKVRKLYSQYL